MIPKRLRDMILDRDGHRCIIDFAGCDVVATIVHHRANRGMGGASGVLDDPANLLASCPSCNGLLEDANGFRRELAYRRGIKLRPAATHQASLDRARETPVEYPDGTLCILTSSGARLTEVKVS